MERFASELHEAGGVEIRVLGEDAVDVVLGEDNGTELLTFEAGNTDAGVVVGRVSLEDGGTIALSFPSHRAPGTSFLPSE